MAEVLVVIFSAIVALWLFNSLYGWWPRDGASTESAAQGFAATSAADQPYGEGSQAPIADNATPSGYSIKGNADSMLYHRPDSRSYNVTIAEVWFDTPERAEAAGFGLANSHPAS